MYIYVYIYIYTIIIYVLRGLLFQFAPHPSIHASIMIHVYICACRYRCVLFRFVISALEFSDSINICSLCAQCSPHPRACNNSKCTHSRQNWSDQSFCLRLLTTFTVKAINDRYTRELIMHIRDNLSAYIYSYY